ncbi:cysteine proteinase [Neoconidiobolus thromboides FSU 785]|nr:cysteine proteinase [Neoconidiobolus thromboides FSU 785]
MTKPGEFYEYDTSVEPLAYTKEQVFQYLNRIQYFNEGEEQALPELSLQTLQKIQTRHLHSIPYGNTSFFYYNELDQKDENQNAPTNPNNLLTTKGASLHPLDIFKKLVTEERDGYCYEHNILLSHILTNLGFNNYIVGARTADQALFIKERKVVMTGLRHCAIIAELNDQKYLLDAGFSSIGNFQPVPVFEQVIEDPECELVPLLDNTHLQVVRRYPPGQNHLSAMIPPFYLAQGKENIWYPLFFFTFTPFFPKDIAHINYYLVMDQTSTYNEHLIIRKYIQEPEGTMAKVFDNQLKLITLDGTVKRIHLRDENGRREALKKYFNVDLSSLKEVIPPSFVTFDT